MATKSNDQIPIRLALRKILDEEKAETYTYGLNIAYSDMKDIYDYGLNSLMSGNTPEVIKSIAFGLDIDREYQSLLHLAKTMSYGISQKLFEEEATELQRKYSDLEKATKLFVKRLEEIKGKHDKLGTEISDLKKKLNDIKPSFFSFKNLYTVYLLRSKDINNKISTLESEKAELEPKIQELKNELHSISRILILIDYSKILRIILEVCVYPSRYKWVVLKK